LHTLYLLSVWLHILAATAWIGAMFFLMFVVVPWMRSGNLAAGSSFLRATGPRLRTVGWVCFAILLFTGTFNLWMRGIHPGDLASPAFLATSYGKVVAAKLLVFALVVAISARHDFVIGPRATVAIEQDPHSAESGSLRRRASLHGRANAVLALVLVALAVMIVRGTPW
jgi:copper resistance protein D